MEVEVIDTEQETIQRFNSKMSGLKKSSDVTIKKGIFGDQEYYTWFNEVAMNTPSRKDVTISLLDEEHNPVMTWKLNNAWPKKIDSPVKNPMTIL